MNFSHEALLVIGVLGFYLFDSICLLYSNQLVVNESFGKWGFVLPSSNWRFMRKIIYIHNLLTPYNQTFILTWSPNANSLDNDFKYPSSIGQNLTFIRLSVTILMYLMLVLLPIVLYKFGLGMLALILLITIYLTIINMSIFLYFKRGTLKLSKKEVLSIAFEVISCPPFAINFLRRISLKSSIFEEPIEFAKRNFDNEEYERFKQQFNQKLLDEIELEDENSQRSIELIKYREKLMENLC
jgi:hypothetical protein